MKEVAEEVVEVTGGGSLEMRTAALALKDSFFFSLRSPMSLQAWKEIKGKDREGD